MEVLIELLFEVVGQIVLEGLVGLGFKGVGRWFARPWVRAALALGVGGSLAFAGGWWWGQRLSDGARVELPGSFYVSIGLAVVFGILAIVRAERGPRPDTFGVGLEDVLEEPGESLRLLSPVHWSPWRLAGFSFINVVAAVGINVGFTPSVGLG